MGFGSVVHHIDPFSLFVSPFFRVIFGPLFWPKFSLLARSAKTVVKDVRPVDARGNAIATYFPWEHGSLDPCTHSRVIRFPWVQWANRMWNWKGRSTLLCDWSHVILAWSKTTALTNTRCAILLCVMLRRGSNEVFDSVRSRWLNLMLMIGDWYRSSVSGVVQTQLSRNCHLSLYPSISKKLALFAIIFIAGMSTCFIHFGTWRTKKLRMSTA